MIDTLCAEEQRFSIGDTVVAFAEADKSVPDFDTRQRKVVRRPCPGERAYIGQIVGVKRMFEGTVDGAVGPTDDWEASRWLANPRSVLLWEIRFSWTNRPFYAFDDDVGPYPGTYHMPWVGPNRGRKPTVNVWRLGR